MNPSHVAFIVMLFSAMASSQADTTVDPVEKKLEALAKQSPKANLPKLLDYNLKKLDAVFQASLKAAVDAEHRKALEDSQKAWLTFFEADGHVAAWNAKGGSYAYPSQVEQKVYQLRLRIHQLATPFLQGWADIPITKNPEAEQASAGQPATRSESDSEGGDKPQPKSEGRSR